MRLWRSVVSCSFTYRRYLRCHIMTRYCVFSIQINLPHSNPPCSLTMFCGDTTSYYVYGTTVVVTLVLCASMSHWFVYIYVLPRLQKKAGQL